MVPAPAENRLETLVQQARSLGISRSPRTEPQRVPCGVPGKGQKGGAASPAQCLPEPLGMYLPSEHISKGLPKRAGSGERQGSPRVVATFHRLQYSPRQLSLSVFPTSWEFSITIPLQGRKLRHREVRGLSYLQVSLRTHPRSSSLLGDMGMSCSDIPGHPEWSWILTGPHFRNGAKRLWDALPFAQKLFVQITLDI